MPREKIRKIAKYLFITIVVIIGLFVVGIISQLIYIQSQWNNGLIEKLKFPSTDIRSLFLALINFPYNLYGLGMTGAICVALMMYFNFDISKFTLDEKRNIKQSETGTYGTSSFMNDEERNKQFLITKEIKAVKGTIMGECEKGLVIIPTNSFLNKNIAVYGSAGSMKSRAYVRNMIFQCVARGESLVITDPKNELVNDFRIYLEEQGYEVKIFNLINPEYSDSWNCLSEIEGNEFLAQVFCDIIIKNTSKGGDVGFWTDAVQNLLKALVLYVSIECEESDKTLGEVYKILTTYDAKKLANLLGRLKNTHPAKPSYNIFAQSSETVQSSIITGLAGRLQIFQVAEVKQITSVNDIKLTNLGTKKCAYFCISSDQDSTFDFLASLFLSFIFIKNVRYADKNGIDGKLPVEIHILADELANIGVIPDLTKKISTVRSRGISLSVIFQNLAQMENRYPDNQWQEIIGNCDHQLFLGCTDGVTAKFVSERSGEATVTSESMARNFGTFQISKMTQGYRTQQGEARRMLLTPDEVLRLPHDEALVITRGQKILPVKKFDFTKHPESKKLVKSRISDYKPKYLQKATEYEKPYEEVLYIEGEGIDYIDVSNEEITGCYRELNTTTPNNISKNKVTKEKNIVKKKDSRKEVDRPSKTVKNKNEVKGGDADVEEQEMILEEVTLDDLKI